MVFLCAAPSTAAPFTTTTKIPGTPGNFQCPGDGLFANPDDCSTFWQCIGGIPFLQVREYWKKNVFFFMLLNKLLMEFLYLWNRNALLVSCGMIMPNIVTFQATSTATISFDRLKIKFFKNRHISLHPKIYIIPEMYCPNVQRQNIKLNLSSCQLDGV